MATKTFEELKQLAIQIRDEKTNKQNTATRIGTQMLEHLDKLEQDYYDKTATDEKLIELELQSDSIIINIIGFGNSAGESGVTKSGDIYYNTYLKEFRKCIDFELSKYEAIK